MPIGDKADGAQQVADTLGVSIETNADLKDITLILGGSGTLPGEQAEPAPAPIVEVGAGPVPADCKAK